MPDTPQEQLAYNPLLQRFFLNPEEKASKEKGKAILKAIYQAQTTDATNLNFFQARNARWIMLLMWAKGSQSIKEFLDYMNISDGNKAFVNIDMTQSRIASQFVGTLVESMAKNQTYPCVNAIDDGSISEKEQRQLDALFRMKEVETINDIQQQAGIQLEDTNAYVPDDELSARVHFELEDRLPKEIGFEELLNLTKNTIQFDRVLNRKSIYDLVVLNCGVTKIEKVGLKNYTVRKCIPTNMTYNFFMNDTGDCEVTQIGEFYNLKVKDFRAKFGKTEERPEGMSEKEVFNLAKLSMNKNIGTFNYNWNDTYSNYFQNRPYDDCSILVFDCEVSFDEDQYYVSKKDSFGRENLQAKKGIPYQQKTKDGRVIEQPKPEDTSIIKSKRNTWMRGVYAPYGDTMLYWGKPDIIITPFTNVAKPLSSYTINIPNNDGEYVPSLFERIMEPLREYQLTKLKRKQLIAKIKPSGIRIDVETARNIDLGNGDSISWEEVVRIYEQTGNEVWSSKGVDPLQPQAPPLGNTVVDKSINDIIGLTNILAGIVNEIRQLIGVPQYRDGSDVGDRTSGVLQEQQNIASYNVTDYILNANNQLWEETFYKLCLLHWNDIVKEEPESKDDMINTRFQVQVKMKSTDYEKEVMEKDIAQYSQVPDAQGNPSLSLKDAMFIREIDDPKLARWYLSKTVEENRRKAIADSSRAIQENAQAQEQSLMAKGKIDDELLTKKLDNEKQLEEFKAQQLMKIEIVRGSFAIAGKSETPTIPDWLRPIIEQLVPNVVIPLAVENKNMEQQVVADAQQEQMMAAQQEQQMMQQEQQMQPM